MAENKTERTVEIIVNGQKANASLKEMNAAAAVLYNQFQKMAADDPGRAKTIADYKAMKDRIGDVKTELGGVSQSAGVMKQAFANAFAMFTGGGIIGAVQQVWSFLSSANEEYKASARVTADLNATLESTRHAAGLTAKEITAIGEARAKVTLFDDDDTNKASAMLLTFTNIKKGVFEDAIPAIQDIATKMGGDGPADLKGASIQVGKALNDPIAGISALSRVGVTFTEVQKDQIKAMVKAGDTAGAQKMILAELNKEFGGSAEAARKAAGGMATLSMRWGEMKETVGSFVSAGLSKLSDWFGRVLDNAQPLVDLIVELAAEFQSYYQEIADVIEGMGLFNSETDTAKMVVDFLKTALTVLLIPFRVLLGVCRGVVDLFIEWYNKSEILRGVLGGLGAMVVSVFTTIKDAAIKILGGVGDILIGVFTLDKDKIIKGFKSALEGTADVALSSGQRAAEAFLKGYEGNKNNQIKRTVRVDTEETSTGDGTLAPSADALAGESEKDRKAREAAAKKAAAELAKQHKLEEEAERKHQEMLLNLQEAALIGHGNLRSIELGKVMLDAQRKALAVTGTEEEKNAAIELLMQEAWAKQSALQEQFKEEDRKKWLEDAQEQLELEELAEADREAALMEKFNAALINQQEYDDLIYEAKKASLERKMALIEWNLGRETKEYQKVKAEQLKLEADHNKKSVENARKAQEEKDRIAQLQLGAAGNVLQGTIDLLFQDESARRKHHDLYVALAGAKLIIDGISEVGAIWKYSAENPYNGPTAGVAGAVMGGIQTALAITRTIYGLSQLGSVPGYFFGGRTGKGMPMSTGMAISPMGQLLEFSGLSVSTTGKLQDKNGPVAGVVHENEYVIPEWLRKDPQVAAFENWVEAKRMRGFFEGGRTSSEPVGADPIAVFGTDGTSSTDVLLQMVGVLRSLDGRLAGVEAWQKELRVVNNLQETDAGLAELKQVEYESAIRKKGK